MTELKHECGAGCDHEEHEMEEVETITLTLDDDTELECIVIGIFDFEDKDYIALTPIETEGEEGDILIYEYKEVGEEEIQLDFIEDEEYFNKVAAEFEKKYDLEEEE